MVIVNSFKIVQRAELVRVLLLFMEWYLVYAPQHNSLVPSFLGGESRCETPDTKATCLVTMSHLTRASIVYF